MAKVSVKEDPALTSQFPANSPCQITIKLGDGTQIQGSRDYPRGDPKDPLSDNELEDKLKDYFFFAENKDELAAVIDGIWNLEKRAAIDWLVAPLKRRRLDGSVSGYSAAGRSGS